MRAAPYVTWINIAGLDVQVLEDLGTHLGLHLLALEDVLHTGQRPKFEEYNSHYFIVLKMIHVEEEQASGRRESYIPSVTLINHREKPEECPSDQSAVRLSSSAKVDASKRAVHGDVQRGNVYLRQIHVRQTTAMNAGDRTAIDNWET